MINAAQVRSIASVLGSRPRADMVAAIVAGWPQAVAKAKLTSGLRAAHFLAQIMTETGGLAILEESGAYSARRMLEIFGVGHHSAKITPAEAQRIASLPVSQRAVVLFNRVYGTGNPSKMREFGNTGPNDGYLYRGGGMMQATGKSNYAALERKTGLPLVAHPELLHSPGSAFTAAYLEWAEGGRCNAAADRDQVEAVRKVINGGLNGIAECRKYLAKAKTVLADYAVDAAPVALLADPQDAPDAPAVEDPVAQAPGALPVAGAAGDPDIYSVQGRLKAMNYSPGVVAGVWGGMTAGALAGFLNDRGSAVVPPASLDAFTAVKAAITAELTHAEAEHFVRPVTAARANADPGTVAAVAPEVLPAKRNFVATAWASIVAFFTALWQLVSDKVAAAWDFVTDHKDDLGDPSSVMSTAWSYLTDVPGWLWLSLAGGALLWIALDARDAVKKITTSVQTGARQ
jgi:predicted chitinase